MNLTVMTDQGSVVRTLEAEDLDAGADLAEELGFTLVDDDGDKTIIVDGDNLP